MQQKGRFIVIEGLEGAGKTTAIEQIKHLLNAEGISYITTREPGGTEVGESIRRLLKTHDFSVPMQGLTELLLLYAARVELLEQVIRPALAKGTWVISDRFELSSFAYQGGGRHVSTELLNCLSTFCVEDTQPDWVVFLDLLPELGMERAKQRGALDRIEQESKLFFQNVYEAYHQRLASMQQVAIIDAAQSLPLVQANINRLCMQFIKAHTS